MKVTAISKRVFRMDQGKQLEQLLRKLRALSKMQPGFISRRTYSRLNDPGECIVISEWESADDWANWMNLKEAREIQWQIDSLIGEKTSFEIYKPEEY